MNQACWHKGPSCHGDPSSNPPPSCFRTYVGVLDLLDDVLVLLLEGRVDRVVAQLGAVRAVRVAETFERTPDHRRRFHDVREDELGMLMEKKMKLLKLGILMSG